MKKLLNLTVIASIVFTSCKPTPPVLTDKEAVKNFLISHTFYESGMDKETIKFSADGKCKMSDGEHDWRIGNSDENDCGIIIDDQDGNNGRDAWHLDKAGSIDHYVAATIVNSYDSYEH